MYRVLLLLIWKVCCIALLAAAGNVATPRSTEAASAGVTVCSAIPDPRSSNIARQQIFAVGGCAVAAFSNGGPDASGDAPLILFFDPFDSNTSNDSINNFRISFFQPDVSNVSINGVAQPAGAGATSFDVNITAPTDFTVQYDFGGATLNFTVNANPNTNMLGGFTVMAGAANTAPELVAPLNVGFPESQSAARTVIDFNANDAEAETENGGGLTYSFTTNNGGGADNGAFNIDTNNGLLTFITAPDFENPGSDDGDNTFEIQVTVTDSGGLTDFQDITVTVTDVVESQTITFNQPADVTFGETASLSATASSSLAVVFSTPSAGICSIVGTTLTAEGVGSCVINANQPGDATFSAAPEVSQTIMILQRDVTLSATQQSKTYGEALTLDNTAFTVADQGNGGDTTLPFGNMIDTVTIRSQTGVDASQTAFVATFSDEIAISAPVAGSSFNANNYNLTFVTGDLVVNPRDLTVTATGQQKEFGTAITLDNTAFTIADEGNAGDTTLPNGEQIDTVTLSSASGADANTAAVVGTLADDITIGAITVANGSVGFDPSNYNITTVASDFTIVDTIAPTVVITTDSGGSFNESVPGTFMATVTFSEAVTGFVDGELTATNATVGTLAPAGGAGTVFTATITPAGTGDVALNVAANVAQDGGGNDNVAAATVTVTQADDVVPTVAITTDSGGSFNASAPGTFTATITFSEVVSGFVDGELTATNATVGTLAPAGGAGTVFTATITPDNNGDVALNVAANVAQDGGGNNNTAAPTVTVTKNDDVAPTVAIINLPANHDGVTPFNVTVQFSEDVLNFVMGDVTIGGGGAVTNFTQVNASTYTVEITPTIGNDVTVDVTANVAEDAAGIMNTAAPQATIGDNSDMDAPTVVITTPSDEHDSVTPFVATVTFNEPVIGFANSELKATNATVGALTNVGGAGTTFTATITPDGPLDIVLSVAANVAEDAAGNMNEAAEDLTITGTIVEQTQIVIANFLQNRANHILSNQPDITGFITGRNLSGGGSAGNLALNATTGSQVLAFSTSRSKILAGLKQAEERALSGIPSQTATSSDPLAVLATQASSLSDSHSSGERVSTPRRGQGDHNVGVGSYGFAGDDATLQTGAELIANQRQAADVVLDGDGNTLATQPSRAGTWDVWTEIYGSSSNSGASDSSLWVGYLGAHYFIDDNTLFGVIGQIDWADETNAEFNSRADGVGFLIGPYIAGQLPGQNLFYEARVSWGTSDNDVSPIGTFTDSFDTTRFLASGKLSGSFAYDQYTISPEVSVSYFEDNQHSYTDTLGNLIPEQTVSLGEIRFGPDISQNIVLDDGTLFAPNIGISGVFNFGIAENAASQGFALGNDDFRARVDAGFSATNPSTGMTLTLEGFYDGIGIEDFDSYGGRARVTVPLN